MLFKKYFNTLFKLFSVIGLLKKKNSICYKCEIWFWMTLQVPVSLGQQWKLKS